MIEKVATNSEGDAYHPFLAWWTVVVLAVFQTVSLIDRNILSLVLIEIRRDLHLNDFELSLLQGLALSCAYGLAGVLVGGLMDRVRLPRILYVCVTCWSLAAVAVGLARNYWGMMFSRMLTGAGEGGITPVGQVMIVSLFPKNRVSLPMSIFFTSGAIGIGLSYFGGGLLLEALTARPIPGLESLAPWRQVLLITALPGLLVALLSFTLRDAVPRRIASHSTLRGWGEFGRFLAAERKLFGRLIAAYGLMAIITLAVFSWAPDLWKACTPTKALGSRAPVGANFDDRRYFCRRNLWPHRRQAVLAWKDRLCIARLFRRRDRRDSRLCDRLQCRSALGISRRGHRSTTHPGRKFRARRCGYPHDHAPGDARANGRIDGHRSHALRLRARAGIGRSAYRLRLCRSTKGRSFDWDPSCRIRSNLGLVHLVGPIPFRGTRPWLSRQLNVEQGRPVTRLARPSKRISRGAILSTHPFGRISVERCVASACMSFASPANRPASS